jgi:hypothetical protein
MNKVNRKCFSKMLERFTDSVRKVVALANQEAQIFNHKYIDNEHILLGLVKEGRGVGATTLKNLGVNLQRMRLEVEKLTKSSQDKVTMGKLPTTPQAKKVIENAIEKAKSLKDNYIGTGHILLSLLESKGIITQILTNLDLKLEDVRKEVSNLWRTRMNDGPNTPRFRTIPITKNIINKMKKVIRASLAYEDAIGGIRKTGITAEVGEIYACYYLKLRLCADPKAEGFDAIDQQCRKVQIKIRRSETKGLPSDLGRLSSFSRHPFDYVILVILNQDYSMAEMWQAEYRDFLPLIEKHKRRNPNLSGFKKVAKRIWTSADNTVKSSRMSNIRRRRGLTYLKKNVPEYKSSEPVAVSKLHKDEKKSYWWFDLPVQRIKQNRKGVYYLMGETEKSKFIVFKVPNKFLINNLKKFDTNSKENRIWLHIKAEGENKFIDERGDGRVDFGPFKL